MRLWGKIFGINSNYIVVEGDFKEGAVDEEDEIVNAPPQEEPVEAEPEAPAEETGGEDGENHEVQIPLPKAKAKVVPSLPRESRSGVNKYVYYVCSHGMFIYQL